MSIIRSTATVSFFIFISRVLGFIRDILIAKYLGAGMLSDVFFASFRLPNFFRRIFAEGAFNSAFVPIFIEKNKLHHEEGDNNEKARGLDFASNIFSILLYVLLIFVLILQLAMPLVVKTLFPGFFSDPVKSALAIDLSRITVFYLLFISLVSLSAGILNSINKFASASSVPIVLNSTLIFFSLFVADKFQTFAHGLAWGVFTAGILQFIWITFFTIKAGFLLYPKMPKLDIDAKKFFRKLLPAVIGGNVMQINLLLDSIFASAISGAVSYLYYADRINQLPLAMIGIAISTALLPSLSRLIKSNKADEAIKLQNIGLEVALIMAIPATISLIIFAHPIITTLFERGKFTSDESLLVSKALMLYSVGLPAFILVKIFEPAFFARGNTRTPMNISILSVAINCFCNFLFYLFNFGYLGIIIASIISSYINLSMLIIASIKHNYFYFASDLFAKFKKIIINNIILVLSALILKQYLYEPLYFSKILSLLISIFLLLIIYFLSTYLSGGLQIMIANFVKKNNQL